MQGDEEILAGGNVSAVVRVGDTVRRGQGPWSPQVHRLLDHLAARGFSGAPRFLGVDGEGREILTFVAGDVFPGARPPYVWGRGALRGQAALLRRYHDATEDLLPAVPGHGWQGPPCPLARPEVLCHNDAALYNVVFRKDTPVALIDFDFAAPGPRLWDVAYMLYSAVPLGRDEPDPATGALRPYAPATDARRRRRRVEAFFGAYGLPVPVDLGRWVLARLGAIADWLVAGAEERDPARQRLVGRGHLAHYREEIAFIRAHVRDWS